jgi:transcriptional antiterminator RfaH
MGITNYCPTITLVKQYSDRKKKVTKPLLSSYVMVELEEKERIKFLPVMELYAISFSLENQRLFLPSEINLMQDHLNGVYNDIKVTTFCGRFPYDYRRALFQGFQEK